jgi:hypothetical protein
LFFITSEIKVTQHDDDEDIVRTKANLIIIYEGIRILNPKPKPDVYDCIRILYRLYMYFIQYIFITWDVVSSN